MKKPSDKYLLYKLATMFSMFYISFFLIINLFTGDFQLPIGFIIGCYTMAYVGQAVIDGVFTDDEDEDQFYELWK